MTVLLGNCLENALEALRPLPAEVRRQRTIPAEEQGIYRKDFPVYVLAE